MSYSMPSLPDPGRDDRGSRRARPELGTPEYYLGLFERSIERDRARAEYAARRRARRLERRHRFVHWFFGESVKEVVDGLVKAPFEHSAVRLVVGLSAALSVAWVLAASSAASDISTVGASAGVATFIAASASGIGAGSGSGARDPRRILGGIALSLCWAWFAGQVISYFAAEILKGFAPESWPDLLPVWLLAACFGWVLGTFAQNTLSSDKVGVGGKLVVGVALIAMGAWLLFGR